METYCIVPYRRTYRVEAISADGAHRVLDVWPTKRRPFHVSELFKLGLTLLEECPEPRAERGCDSASIWVRRGICCGDEPIWVMECLRSSPLRERAEQEHRRLVEKWNLWRQLGMIDKRTK